MSFLSVGRLFVTETLQSISIIEVTVRLLVRNLIQINQSTKLTASDKSRLTNAIEAELVRMCR